MDIKDNVWIVFEAESNDSDLPTVYESDERVPSGTLDLDEVEIFIDKTEDEIKIILQEMLGPASSKVYKAKKFDFADMDIIAELKTLTQFTVNDKKKAQEAGLIK